MILSVSGNSAETGCSLVSPWILLKGISHVKRSRKQAVVEHCTKPQNLDWQGVAWGTEEKDTETWKCRSASTPFRGTWPTTSAVPWVMSDL